ncbi:MULTISPECIES: tetratricopeptide repeat protein [unclassified Yoonia]|uniref:tetratricopeptide repeat protein n=1 Tax=unclassified Yoonia TaxID=2629118 RepID=UPI002AFF4D94|nr:MULTISPECIES: tetratricopeptide repeat protein [unclassified Yoonia]
MRLILCLMCFATSVVAETCPAAPDHGAEQARIIAELGKARTQAEAAPLTQGLWRLWTDAPDAAAKTLLVDGMDLLTDGAPGIAVTKFDALIAYCPDYAEGYNQRAFAHYLQGDFAGALDDLDAALAINPLHVAALSGKALTLMGLGRDAQAQEVLRAAVALNPWLQERALLVTPPGVEL